ncbi:MAG: (Fe-S)-binding protein [Caldibacillus thermoamylovorans]|uniref:(Fe-S)-binding protein n=1 Tax=Bacillaceae TaxID=186817 RepID=UPI000D558604|nr:MULTISPECIES: (Fe-S)-binding protein [Bacillaceae]MCB5934159.1 (Fe-S)-binding protein [Bacillus sp. DFI.2.34]NWN97448.1 (Fe-S)-binding protein [Bacillus sp. (in: firmicutes)]AWI11788.1 Fe-S oxidoreductase [Caldibacillus thermoamylovorans]MBU5341841.1 (Fe-S)-binding protein [Caldifermentibacillus hisashii]MCB7075740.1 (Fe-S)-binding protein [Caldibacillus thermoamylovorans]
MKVSLFITCISDIMFPNVGKNTVEILERLGCEVDFPTLQTCCGQPAYNSGYLEEAKGSMKQMIRAFKDAEYVVGPSGSCVGMIREYPHVFKGDSEWEKPAQELAAKTFELTQFIVDVLGVKDVGSTFKGKVTYHPSCHMTRILGVKDAPKILLQNVKGIEFVELPSAEDCCGFGGTFSVKKPEISAEMVKEKSRHVTETGAEYLVGGDMGCLMNIGGRMQREGKNVKVIHISEILNTHN